MNLHSLIQEAIKGRGSSQKELADAVGINRTTLSKYLKGNSRLRFDNILKLVRFLFPDREKEIMTAYARDRNHTHLRQCLEYAYINRIDSLKDELLERLQLSSNKVDQEWATVYGLNNRENYSYKLLHVYKNLKLISTEMKIFSQLVTSLIYWHLNLYGFAYETCLELEEKIKKIKDPFIRNSYTARFGAAMASYCLYLDERETCQHYSQLVLDTAPSPIFKATAYLSLGNSYIFESYEETIHFLSKCFELSNQERHDYLINLCKDTFNFAQNYWGHTPQFLNFESKRISDQTEIAFYYIKRNNHSEAKKILDSIDPENLSNIEKAFYYYFRGLITKAETDFSKSVYYFKTSGDLFYLNLPIMELKKLGINTYLIHSIKPIKEGN
ncbi:transcriptional regulator with XRE-family HTH domain [Caldalkalibacillus uzonensis]|uniref:Transcriptional regulator with XRE-family HTH domain n=1 Tax=Caldalkalibacillus uzonensis TaxID=353224 RepID=A0ABU0CXJ0_9BACI|nr:AimR family lysis-lysogeny pheromone receptor [Caldalkalibacillus uzonensis]MDQ0340142.1 transcriptional regulator with XRE-family HTH domain [Caldalkalibacillus uzonensis]